VRLENLPLAPGKELDAKLHDRFPLYHGKVPADGGLLEGVRGALEEMLASQSIKATITAIPYTDRKLKNVTAMSFSITAPQVELGEMHMDSTSAPLDPQAQNILVKQSGSPYDAEGSPNQIETNLANYYNDKGYLEAEIHATPQFPVTATPAAIRVPFLISVSPGTLYKLSGVQLAPGLLVTQADFDKQSRIHPGDVATSQYVRENWEFLARQYHNKGYMKAVVNPTPSFDRAQGSVSFSVTVDPGPAYTMGTLRIDNVSDDLRTRMLAAWKMPAGAVFNEGAINGFFATYAVNPALERVFATVNYKYTLTLNDDTHTVDVVLRLEKRP
jgi:outer membrane protein insertion porin family